MSSERLAFLSILALGIAAALSFHSSGAVSERDAMTLAGFEGGVATSPPGPVTTHVTHLGTRLVQLVWSATGLFRAAHLVVGLLLALSAALSACLAHRAARAGGSDGAAWAGAVLVGGSLLFGGHTGRLGLETGPAAILLALLSGTAIAWTAERPRAALGGFLLGLALADHPLVLFVLPGFGAIALGGTLRVAPADGAGFLRRAGMGFLVGFAAVLVPIVDAQRPGLLLVSNPTSILGALEVWWGKSPSVWSGEGPSAWGSGLVEWTRALWKNAGPLGMVLGFAGVLAFFRGQARSLRPFLVVHSVLALAIITGRPADPDLSAALAGWSFLFWSVPTLSVLRGRRRAVAAFVSVVILFVMNVRTVNRSAEKGVAWAATVLETAPPDALLLTLNPVQLALAADGLRPDVDVVHLEQPSTLEALRTGRILLPEDQAVPALKIGPTTIRALFAFNLPLRPVLVDPSVYFLDESLGGTRDVRYRFSPHGTAFRVRHADDDTPNADATASTIAWEGLNVTPGTPPSPLRGGLTGGEFYARALLTSGSLYLEEGREIDAERDFLLALGHPSADRTTAARSLARIFFERGHYDQAIHTLETYVRDTDPTAWLAYKLLASAYVYDGRPDDARRALQSAMSLVPSELSDQRIDIQRLLDGLERRGGATP